MNIFCIESIFLANDYRSFIKVITKLCQALRIRFNQIGMYCRRQSRVRFLIIRSSLNRK